MEHTLTKNELENNSVHSHIMAHYDACYGGDDMTCKDCIHFYEREPKPWRDIFDLGYCDHSREGKIEINKYCHVNKWCDNKFEPTHESVGNALDALDSWESVSK